MNVSSYKHRSCFDFLHWVFLVVLSMNSFLVGQDGVQEIGLNQYLNDISNFYTIIRLVERGSFIQPPMPPPAGYVPNPEDYDWGYYYRLVILAGHRDDVVFLERIKRLNEDTRIEKVLKIDLDVMFLGGEGYGNKFITVEDVRWISTTSAIIMVTYGTTDGLITDELELDINTILE